MSIAKLIRRLVWPRLQIRHINQNHERYGDRLVITTINGFRRSGRLVVSLNSLPHSVNGCRKVALRNVEIGNPNVGTMCPLLEGQGTVLEGRKEFGVVHVFLA